MKYHVEIDERFWEERYADWHAMTALDKSTRMGEEVLRIRDFLKKVPPPGEIFLLVTKKGTVRITLKESLVRVKPIEGADPHQGVSMTQMKPPITPKTDD